MGRCVAERYELGELIGEGGMGSVHRATHNVTGKQVALKLVAGEGAVNAESLTRFRREARAAGVLETEHIVQVYDSGVDRESGLPYIAMELLNGESLKQLLDRLGPIAPDAALRIVAQAASGLVEAHRAGVVHRDIKPSNLFIAEVGERIVVKVLDFGIAKLDPGLRDVTDADDLTHTGTLLGSPHYMAPEQIRTQGKVDHRADIWSLGVVLYESMCGRRPHETAKNMMELMFRTYMEKPSPIRKHAPWLTAEDASIVAKSLELAPSDRYADMSSLRDAIAARVDDLALTEDMLVAAGRDPVPAARPSADDAATMTETVAAPDSERMRARYARSHIDDVTPPPSSTLPTPPMSSLWRPAIVAAAVVVAGAATVVAMTDESTPAETTAAPSAVATEAPAVQPEPDASTQPPIASASAPSPTAPDDASTAQTRPTPHPVGAQPGPRATAEPKPAGKPDSVVSPKPVPEGISKGTDEFDN